MPLLAPPSWYFARFGLPCASELSWCRQSSQRKDPPVKATTTASTCSVHLRDPSSRVGPQNVHSQVIQSPPLAGKSRRKMRSLGDWSPQVHIQEVPLLDASRLLRAVAASVLLDFALPLLGASPLLLSMAIAFVSKLSSLSKRAAVETALEATPFTHNPAARAWDLSQKKKTDDTERRRCY